MVVTSSSSAGIFSLSSKCFAGDYGSAQTNAAIITPTS
ncbi:unnamed protein product, partial [marine sediment metagenome]